MGGAVGLFNPTNDSNPATKLKMGFSGITGAAGVMAGVTGATDVTAAWITAGVGDNDTAACGVTTAVNAGADPLPVAVSDTDDRVAGSGDSAPITVCTWAGACTTPWCTPPATGLPANGVELGDEVEPALNDAGVLVWPAGVLGDVTEGAEDVPVVVKVGRLPPLEDTVLGGAGCLYLGG